MSSGPVIERDHPDRLTMGLPPTTGPLDGVGQIAAGLLWGRW